MPRFITYKNGREAFNSFFHVTSREMTFSGRCSASFPPSHSLYLPCSDGWSLIRRYLPHSPLLLSTTVQQVRYLSLPNRVCAIYRPHNARLFESSTSPPPSLLLSSSSFFFSPISVFTSPRCSVAALTHLKRWTTTSALAPLVVEKEKRSRGKEAGAEDRCGAVTDIESNDWTGTYKKKKSRSKKIKEEVKMEKNTKRRVKKKVKKCSVMKKTQSEEEDNPLEVKYAAASSDELLESAGMTSSVHLRRKLSQQKQQQMHHGESSYRCEEEEDEGALSVSEGDGEEEDFTDFNLMEGEDEVRSLTAEMSSPGIERRKHFLLKRKRRKKKRRERIFRRRKERAALLQLIDSERMRVDSATSEAGSHTEKEGESSSVLEHEASNEKIQLEEEAQLQQRVKEGSKALIHHFPSIAAEYDAEANQQARCASIPSLDSLSIHSSSVVSWKCHKCQHCWKAAVFIRCILESGCPQCEGKVRPIVAKDKPELLSSWAKEYNDPFLSLDSLTVDCSKSVHWRCPSCEHVYSARVKDQVHGQKVFCPSCGKSLFGKYPEKKRRKKRIPLPKIYFRQVFSEADPDDEARIVKAVKKAYAIRKELKEKSSREAIKSTDGGHDKKRRSSEGEKKRKNEKENTDLTKQK